MIATEDTEKPPARERKAKGFDSEGARKAQAASAAARRRKRQEREQAAEQSALTFRQRLGVSLSRLSQEDLDQAVQGLVKRGQAQALAQLANQAFGKPTEAEPDAPTDPTLSDLTREQRAAFRAMLEEEGDDPRDAVLALDNENEPAEPTPHPPNA